jgi:hypothetical protein
MDVNTSMSPTQLQTAVSVDVMKKSQDVVKNEIGKILEDTFKNTMQIQQEAAAATGAGTNLNIQA